MYEFQIFNIPINRLQAPFCKRKGISECGIHIIYFRIFIFSICVYMMLKMSFLPPTRRYSHYQPSSNLHSELFTNPNFWKNVCLEWSREWVCQAANIWEIAMKMMLIQGLWTNKDKVKITNVVKAIAIYPK